MEAQSETPTAAIIGSTMIRSVPRRETPCDPGDDLHRVSGPILRHPRPPSANSAGTIFQLDPGDAAGPYNFSPEPFSTGRDRNDEAAGENRFPLLKAAATE